MTNGSSERLDKIEALLQQSIVASDERMTRIEQSSNVRLTRIEQIVESNNRFLEGFGERIERYTTRMDNLANKLDNFSNRIDGVIFTANQDRQETNIRLSRIENKVDRLLSRDSDD